VTPFRCRRADRPAGHQQGSNFYAYLPQLLFVPDAWPDFAMLRKGDEITPDVILRKDADQA
jgi:hypothetical protein